MPNSRIVFACIATLLFVCAGIARGDETKTEVALALEPIDLLGDARWRHAGSITHIEPLADGRRALSTSRDGSVRLWDLTDGRELRRFVPASGDDIWNVKLLPGEGEFLSCGEDKHVTRWNLETGKIIARYKLSATGMRLAIVPGGKQFIVCDSGRHASLWDTELGVRRLTYKGHKDSVYSAAISPDGKQLVTCSEDGSVRAWEIASGKQLWVIAKEENPFAEPNPFGGEGPFGAIEEPAPPAGRDPFGGDPFACDPFGAEPADDLDDLFGEPKEERQGPKKQPGPGHYEDVFTVCFMPDGKRVVSCSEDHSIAMWHALDGELLWKQSISGGAKVVACSPDGEQLAVTSDDATIHLLSTADGKRLRKINAPGDSHWTVAWSRDGKRLLSGGDHIIHQWDAATGKQLFPPPKNDHVQGALHHIAVSPDGRTLYAACHKKIHVWDLKRRQRTAVWPAPEDVFLMQFSPDGQRLLLAGHNQFMVRGLSTGKSIHLFDIEISIHSAALANNGKLFVAAGYGRQLAAWKTDDGQQVYDIHEEEDNDFEQLVVSRDGRRMFTVGERSVEARKVSDGSVITRFDRRGGDDVGAAVALADDRALLLFSETSDRGRVDAYLPNIARSRAPLSAGEVRRLASQLGDDAFADRERAMQTLIQGGPPVLSELAETKTDDNEVRWRLAKIRDGIREGMIPTLPLEPVDLPQEAHAAAAHPKFALWASLSGYNAQAFAQLGRLHETTIELGKPVADGHSPKCLAFSPDGTRLYTGNRDGTISVYRLNVADKP